jgi:hypothetical protein
MADLAVGHQLPRAGADEVYPLPIGKVLKPVTGAASEG